MTAAIASKLAADVIANGLIALRICTLAGHADSARIQIEACKGLRARAKGVLIWMASRHQAEKVIREIFVSDRRSRRTDDGPDLIIKASAIEAERLVRHFAALNGYRLISDDDVAGLKARITNTISATLARMQVDGRLSHINRQYKALGPSRPPYNAFLAEQLRGIGQFSPTDMPSLLHLL